MIGFWTDERIELLKKFWAEGLSCSQVAAELGHVTRNAVIGKIHRLGLERRGIKVSQAELFRREQRRQARNASRVIRQREQRQRHRFWEDKPMQELPPAPEPFVGSLNILFNDLRDYSSSESNECRYVADGGPDYLACGTPTLDGESYCAHCKGIVYVRPVNISAAERERRSRQATRNWKAAEVRLTGAGEAFA